MRIKLVLVNLFAVLVLSACSASGPAGALSGTEAAPSPKWKVHIGSTPNSEIDAPVAVSNGMLFVPAVEWPSEQRSNEHHFLQGLDAADGRFRWHMETGESKGAQPVTDGETVYFVSEGYDYTLYAIDPVTGVPRWKLPLGGDWAISPTVRDGMVYVQCRCPRDERQRLPPSRVLALDSHSGGLVWEIDLEDEEDQAVAVSDELVYFVTDYSVDRFVADYALNAVDRNTGQPRWQFKPEFLYSIAPVTDGDEVYVTGLDESMAGQLFALDAATGKEQWRMPIEHGPIHTLDIQNGVAFVGTLEFTEYASPTPTSFLYAIDLESQRLKWQFGNWSASGQVVADQDTIYFSTYTQLLALDGETGSVKWKFSGEGLTDPTIADGILYIGDSKGDLYAIPLPD